MTYPDDHVSPPNIERAATLLRQNSGGDAERQINALKGIGFALLTLAEQKPDETPHGTSIWKAFGEQPLALAIGFFSICMIIAMLVIAVRG